MTATAILATLATISQPQCSDINSLYRNSNCCSNPTSTAVGSEWQSLCQRSGPSAFNNLCDTKDCSVSEWDTTMTENRQRNINSIKELMGTGEFGMDTAGTLHFGEGASTSLLSCPAGWSETQGIVGNEINHYITNPETVGVGPDGKPQDLSAYSYLATGMRIWYKHFNSLNLLGGKKMMF